MRPLQAVALVVTLIVGAPGEAREPARGADRRQAISIEWTVAQQGVAARFYRPGRSHGAAVLLLVGSEGGYAPEALARSLADAGHPVLALAYFSGLGPQLPGISARLERVPLEYFDHALDALAAATRRPLAVMGESRGAEAALLVASRRQDVRLVIAFAPSSTVWQSPGTGGRRPAQPAWTTQGEPVPYAIDIGVPGRSSTDDFAAALTTSASATLIPVERIRARTLLVAGEDDQIWPSAAMATQIAGRMRAAGGRADALIYPHAGHLLMGPGPGEIRIVTPDYSIEFGGTEVGNLTARNAAWSRALAALDHLPKR